MIAALTIAEPVAMWLEEGPRCLWVHSAFSRAINLVGKDGRFLTLLAESADDGPFALRLSCPRLPPVQAGTPALVDPGTLAVSPLLIDWQSATRWNPTLRPLEKPLDPYSSLNCLHESDSVFVRALFALSPLLSKGARVQGGRGERLVSIESLLFLPCTSAPPLPCLEGERADLSALHTRLAIQAATHLAALGGDDTALTNAARALLGFGEGLTPAGDDCLLGVLAARRMVGEPAGVLEEIIRGSASRTTSLSAAFLRAACNGQFAAHWHRLRDALAGEDAGEIEEAARRVLAHGATSGADALVGWVVGMTSFGSEESNEPHGQRAGEGDDK